MINFNEIKLIVKDNYSFVGIKKQKNTLYFFLPHGFKHHIHQINTFTIKRNLFFSFYKIFIKFKEICIEKGYLSKDYEFGTHDRDGVINSNRGSEIQDKHNEGESENIFYSKLDIIGRLLDAYDEPKILTLAYRLGKSDKLDVSQIHRYLHQAVYLPNHAAYVDKMINPKRVLKFESTDIVAMYCYIFNEIKQQLEEVVSSETIALSERFSQKYIRSQDSLFNENSYQRVLGVLKDALEAIDHNTSIKDADYWQYYEVIEQFLYGDWHQSENGKILGIDNFHSIWESMCLTYLAQIVDPSLLLYLDTRYVSFKTLERIKSSTKAIDISQCLHINGSPLFPDAIILRTSNAQSKTKKTYKLLANTGWNDYGYKTIFQCPGIPELKIAYIGQSYDHTFEKLNNFLQKDSDGNLIIDTRLPNNFYSFWDVPEQLDDDCLHKMLYFNHLFYLAIEKWITDWDKFQEEILQSLGIVFGLRYNDPKSNVFTHSLFRYYTVEMVKEKFNVFVTKYLKQNQFCFEIIDIKYLHYEDFFDINNIENIKRRSIRKQFVYEYLLQKFLEHNKQFINFNICSSFWLPTYETDNLDIQEEGVTFMDGYIQLKNVNFMMLAESYVA